MEAGRPKNRTCAHVPPEDAAVYKSGGQMTHDVGMGAPCSMGNFSIFFRAHIQGHGSGSSG